MPPARAVPVWVTLNQHVQVGTGEPTSGALLQGNAHNGRLSLFPGYPLGSKVLD